MPTVGNFLTGWDFLISLKPSAFCWRAVLRGDRRLAVRRPCLSFPTPWEGTNPSAARALHQGCPSPNAPPSRWPPRPRRSPGLRARRREAKPSGEGRRRASPRRWQTGSSFSPDVSPLGRREKRQLCLLAHAGGDGGREARRWKGSRVEPAAQPPLSASSADSFIAAAG